MYFFFSLFLHSFIPSSNGLVPEQLQFSLNSFFQGNSIHSFDSFTTYVSLALTALLKTRRSFPVTYVTPLIFPRHLDSAIQYKTQGLYSITPFHDVFLSEWHFIHCVAQLWNPKVTLINYFLPPPIHYTILLFISSQYVPNMPS